MTPAKSHLTHSSLATTAAAVLLWTATAGAAPPTTAPAEPFEAMHVDTTFRGNFESYTTLVLHAAPGVSPLDPASLKDSLESIWWRPAGAGTQAWLALQDAEIIDDAATVQLLIRYDGTSPNNPTMVPQLVDRLNALAATTANLSDTDRQKELRTVNQQITRAANRKAALLVAVGKYQSLQRTLDELQGQLTGKPSRQQAMEMKIQELKDVAAKQRDTDAIARELRNIVDLRQQQFEQAKKMRDAATISSSELDQKAIDLSEAKVRLAEREASLTKSGKGEILDRLTDELTLLSVDVTNLEIQIAETKKQMAALDPTTIKPEALDALPTPTARPSGRNKPPYPLPLYDELENQRRSLLRRRLALTLAKASLPPPPPTAPTQPIEH